MIFMCHFSRQFAQRTGSTRRANSSNETGVYTSIPPALVRHLPSSKTPARAGCQHSWPGGRGSILRTPKGGQKGDSEIVSGNERIWLTLTNTL
jgi:hypothetical protein